MWICRFCESVTLCDKGESVDYVNLSDLYNSHLTDLPAAPMSPCHLWETHNSGLPSDLLTQPSVCQEFQMNLMHRVVWDSLGRSKTWTWVLWGLRFAVHAGNTDLTITHLCCSNLTLIYASYFFLPSSPKPRKWKASHISLLEGI